MKKIRAQFVQQIQVSAISERGRALADRIASLIRVRHKIQRDGRLLVRTIEEGQRPQEATQP
jgi:hypothetical protein